MFSAEDGLPEIIISESYNFAKIMMKSEWRWTPQRIKKAVVIAREIDLTRIRNLELAYVYVASYPEKFDKIHEVVSESRFIVGNPWKGSTIDPCFFTD